MAVQREGGGDVGFGVRGTLDVLCRGGNTTQPAGVSPTLVSAAPLSRKRRGTQR
jgi:hypothetical protein